jgi:Ca2+-binding RTX toxin-like protein
LAHYQGGLHTPDTTAGLSINRSLDTLYANEDAAGLDNNITEGSFGDDQVTGRNVTDILLGLLEADTLRGGAGDDIIQGSEGVDELYGEHGSDVLHGGMDSDRLYGAQVCSCIKIQ